MSAGGPPVHVLGTGRVGTALLTAWARAEVPLGTAWSRSEEGAARPGQDMVTVLWGGELPVITRGATVVLAVPDDAIAELAERLLARGDLPGDVVLLHCSGVADGSALGAARAAGHPCGSLHPLQTVADDPSGADALTGAPAVVEGDPVAEDRAFDLARAAGLEPRRIPGSTKALYHAAAVLASNDIVALVHLAAELMERSGAAAEGEGHAMLLPLLRQTVENIASKGPAGALTGPVARGDVGTVRKHLAALPPGSPADLAYRVLALAASELAPNLDPAAAAAIIDELG